MFQQLPFACRILLTSPTGLRWAADRLSGRDGDEEQGKRSKA